MQHPPPWHAEIVELHAFFVTWLGAEVPHNEETFTRCSGVLTPNFAIIGPDGQLTERDETVAALYASYGTQPGLKLWIERPMVRYCNHGQTLVTYEEWQTDRGVTIGRASTALFIDTPNTPHGVLWGHIHETWLPNQQTLLPTS